MNAVERVVHYSSDRLAQEAPYEIEKSKPAASWPSKGALVFEDVVMAYREDLQPASLSFLIYSVRVYETDHFTLPQVLHGM